MPVTPLLPSLAVNPMVPAMLSEGLAVWAQRGREFRVSQADAPGPQRDWMWDKRRRCGSQGCV